MARSYQSERRDEAARRTRATVVTAARDLFVAKGYAETSVAAIAGAAGVSSQTIYNIFGTKAELLKAVYDVTLVGDDEPVPFADRREVQALIATEDPRSFLNGYAAIGVTLFRRLGALLTVIRSGASAGSADLVAHLDRIDGERLLGVTGVVQRLVRVDALAAGVSPEQARDAIWMLNSVEVWELLTVRRGWSDERYAAWVGRAMGDAVLAAPPPAES